MYIVQFSKGYAVYLHKDNNTTTFPDTARRFKTITHATRAMAKYHPKDEFSIYKLDTKRMEKGGEVYDSLGGFLDTYDGPVKTLDKAFASAKETVIPGKYEFTTNVDSAYVTIVIGEKSEGIPSEDNLRLGLGLNEERSSSHYGQQYLSKASLTELITVLTRFRDAL